MSENFRLTKQYRCLFCQSREEQNVVRYIHELHLGTAIFPQKVEAFGRRGVWRDITKPLLPGYVFVCSDEAYPIQRLLAINGILRVLTYGPMDSEGYLKAKDRMFVEWLFQNNGMINKLEAIREGSFVRIVDGFLKDYNGKVIKVAKQKRMACLALEITGSVQHIWLGFELMEEHEKAER